MKRRQFLATGATVGSSFVAGCVTILSSGKRYGVEVASVSVNGGSKQLLAITPTDAVQLPKGAEITIDAGTVTYSDSATMNYDRTAYLGYRPTRSPPTFSLLHGSVDEANVRGLTTLDFRVDAVEISARGRTERHELNYRHTSA